MTNRCFRGLNHQPHDVLQYSAMMGSGDTVSPPGPSPPGSRHRKCRSKTAVKCHFGRGCLRFWGAWWGSIGGSPKCTWDRHRQKRCGQTAMSARVTSCIMIRCDARRKKAGDLHAFVAGAGHHCRLLREMVKLMTNSFMGTLGVRGQGEATGKAMVGRSEERARKGKGCEEDRNRTAGKTLQLFRM